MYQILIFALLVTASCMFLSAAAKGKRLKKELDTLKQSSKPETVLVDFSSPEKESAPKAEARTPHDKAAFLEIEAVAKIRTFENRIMSNSVMFETVEINNKAGQRVQDICAVHLRKGQIFDIDPVMAGTLYSFLYYVSACKYQTSTYWIITVDQYLAIMSASNIVK